MIAQLVPPSGLADDRQPSHNLLGQKLGRKGRDTRDRILAAADRVLAGPSDTGLSLTSVAREASLAMTTLYVYFADLTELIIAVLGPIMASAETSYMACLRRHWPDDTLSENCREFVDAYYSFWQKNTRILHLRNTLSDANEPRMLDYRINISRPIIELFERQMNVDPADRRGPKSGMPTILFTAIERVTTIATSTKYLSLSLDEPDIHLRSLLRAMTDILEMGVRDCRRATEHRPN